MILPVWRPGLAVIRWNLGLQIPRISTLEPGVLLLANSQRPRDGPPLAHQLKKQEHGRQSNDKQFTIEWQVGGPGLPLNLQPTPGPELGSNLLWVFVSRMGGSHQMVYGLRLRLPNLRLRLGLKHHLQLESWMGLIESH